MCEGLGGFEVDWGVDVVMLMMMMMEECGGLECERGGECWPLVNDLVGICD